MTLMQIPNLRELIQVTIAGETFQTCQFCAAHLRKTIDALGRRFPNARLEIIQPCWNTGVALSAGTHDKCACLDVRIVGLGWWDAQRFLRELGWAAWFRFPPAFSEHIHMISLGCQQELGEFVPGQIDDYHRHALGLKGQHDSGLDTSWFPSDIDATVFDYQTYMENNMPLDTEAKKEIKDLVTDIVNSALSDFAKNAGALIKVDSDGDPNTAKISLERKLRGLEN